MDLSFDSFSIETNSMCLALLGLSLDRESLNSIGTTNPSILMNYLMLLQILSIPIAYVIDLTYDSKMQC